MKTCRFHTYAAISLVTLAMASTCVWAAPLGTAITYQGQLKQSGVPYNGTADLRFSLYSVASGGTAIAGPVTLAGVSVVSGLFTAGIDFGSSAFNGDARWMGIEVRTPAGSGSYLALSPRQMVTTTPYSQALRLPLSQTINTAATAFTIQNSGTGEGIRGHANANAGLYGTSNTGQGVYGSSDNGIGVEALSLNGNYGAYIQALNGTAVHAEGYLGASIAELGGSTAAVSGVTTASGSWGVRGERAGTIGALGAGSSGVYGTAASSTGVYGVTTGDGAGLISSGVWGECTGANCNGVLGRASGPGGRAIYGISNTGWAGYFSGKVEITGPLIKPAGSFRIDHPLDPARKYLQHSFVESPDMKNVYDGVVTTDAKGYAEIVLPDWFEALNKDFRYQLTVIDPQDNEQFVQAKVVKPVAGNRFTIRTSRPTTQVSWQITGIRKDAYAQAHPIDVEVTKPPEEQDSYLHPELYGQPADKQLDKVREQALQVAIPER